jgi:hypothetical protein
MKAGLIIFGVNRYCPDVQILRSAGDTDGDLAAIGDQK